MKRILITGMSGTGKSTVIERMATRGYKAQDVDQPGWSLTASDGDWIWNEERVHALLNTEDADVLFVSGCAENQVRFHPQFDLIILLSAPAEVIIERLNTRTNNHYGKDPAEQADVLHYLETIEPRLRQVVGHEIDTTVPLDAVVEEIVRLAEVCE